MEYKFERPRSDKIPRDKMICELETVAKIFNYVEFGWRDFNKVANISAGTVKREFGSWKKALECLREHLKRKSLDLYPRGAPPNRIYSDKELFEEIERIWKELGHRPSRVEWNSTKPKISYGCYKNRFNGWTNACLKFIEYKMGETIIPGEGQHQPEFSKENSKSVKSEDRRDVPLKLRLDVLNRDNFRCVFCGKSPATDIGVVLHIDHVVPFSKGGKTVFENLQTLCLECNLGKSNREINSKLVGK